MNIQNLKDKLLEEKKLVLQELSEVGAIDPDTNEWGPKPDPMEESAPDANDLGDRFEDFEEKNSETITLSKRLNEINKALENMDSGTYGKCSVCDEQIEEERMIANPAADTCVKHMDN